MTLEESIRSWVVLDNQIRTLTDQLRSLRARRGEAQNLVLERAKVEGALSARVRVSDGYLRFAQVRTTPPLSLRYVDSCLRKCVPDPQRAARIMSFIKDARQTKSEMTIKRIVQQTQD